jgi:hypothetical protein
MQSLPRTITYHPTLKQLVYSPVDELVRSLVPSFVF